MLSFIVNESLPYPKYNFLIIVPFLKGFYKGYSSFLTKSADIFLKGLKRKAKGGKIGA